MNEWRMLKENNNYEINVFGQIRRIKTKHTLKPAKTKNGYLTLSLSTNGKCKTYLVHRLVANNFLKNENNYKEINHLDGNKLNNNINNLEWCSRSHNVLEAYKIGLRKKSYGINNKLSKKVKQIEIKTGKTRIWNSLSDITREKGYSSGSICDVCKGRLKTAYNSKWEYV